MWMYLWYHEKCNRNSSTRTCYEVLISLNESFSNLRTQIILQYFFTFIKQGLALITREERQREIKPSAIKIENVILLAKSSSNTSYNAAYGRPTNKFV